MLVRNYVIFVVWIERLMLRRDVDLLSRKLYSCEILQQVCVMGGVEVDVCE